MAFDFIKCSIDIFLRTACQDLPITKPSLCQEIYYPLTLFNNFIEHKQQQINSNAINSTTRNYY